MDLAQDGELKSQAVGIVDRDGSDAGGFAGNIGRVEGPAHSVSAAELDMEGTGLEMVEVAGFFFYSRQRLQELQWW